MMSGQTSSGKMSLAKARYDNIAESPDELAFRKGDVLTVIEQNINGLDGWWLCSFRGKQGIVPANRLMLLAGMYNESVLRFNTDPDSMGLDYDVPRPQYKENPQQPTNATYDVPTQKVPAQLTHTSTDLYDTITQPSLRVTSSRLQQVSPSATLSANDSAIDVLSGSSRSSVMSTSSQSAQVVDNSNIYDSLSGPPVSVIMPSHPSSRTTALSSTSCSDYRDSGVYDNARHDDDLLMTADTERPESFVYDVPTSTNKEMNIYDRPALSNGWPASIEQEKRKDVRSVKHSVGNEYDYCDLEELREVEEAPVITSMQPQSNDHLQDIKYLRYHYVRIESLYNKIHEQCNLLRQKHYGSQMTLMATCKSLLVSGHQILYISDSLTHVLRRNALISSIKTASYALSNSLKSLAMSVRELMQSDNMPSLKLDEIVNKFEKSIQSFQSLLKINISS